DPPLSSVDQPGFEMGREAARMLLRLINHDPELPPLEPESRVLPTTLVVRGSSSRR
ncbi:MAG: substrate-binding domain-containing protein, partial [Bacteroidota bacterium]